MKNIRGSILGTGPVLQGFRSANIRLRTFRRLPAFRSSKVTYSSIHTGTTMNTCRLFPRRHVSTGPRKSQMAVVGVPSKMSAISPNPVDINKFISSVPGKRSGNLSLGPVAPRKLSKNIPPSATNAGEFLSTSFSSKNASFDPFAIEFALLPTFHSYQEQFHGIFRHKVGVNVDPKTSTPAKPSEESIGDSSELPTWDEKSWKAPDADLTNSSENGIRGVKKEIILPRELKPLSSEERFQVFVDIHRFDESDAKNNAEKKDISGFPLGGDHTTIPTGQFIIHSGRSSYIINRDLYVTNRILDKLKKRDKQQPTDGEPSEPIVKASSVSEGLEDPKASPQLEDENIIKLLPKRSLDALPKYTPKLAHKSKSDTNFLSSVWPFLNPASKNLPKDNIQDDTPLELAGQPKEVFKSYSGSSVPNNNALPKVSDSNYLPANVEFRNPPLEMLSPLEFRAFESRKNLYKTLVRNTPCYLVDGLHIKNVSAESSSSPKLPEDSLSKGDSVEISNTSSLPCEGDDGEWGLPFRNSDKYLNEAEDDIVCEQQTDFEEWFIPLGNEIDSMLSTLSLSKSNGPVLDAESSNSHKQVEVHGDMDFKDSADHIGVSEITGVPEIHFKNGLTSFESLENIENVSLLKFGDSVENPRSGHVRFNSSSTPPKPPNPPKQSNPNVDIKTETTIKCCRSGSKTDIHVIETQRYLDKRLPYPFSTETVLQVCGTNDSLYKAAQAVENSKSQLVHLSNANAPNPGMAIPKLQFNHMLSKTHEIANQSANNKKRVLKIKTVTESSASRQYSPPPNISLSEPSSVSHVLQAPKPGSDVSRDAFDRDLTRRSKYPHKTGSKKIRRSESVKQLRSRKKQINDEIGENITVLGPKDLERMFPTPPKPKPVEKPRNVTVNNQAANANVNYNPLNLAEVSKEMSKITLKAKKNKDKWLLVKKKGVTKPGDAEGRENIPQVVAKVEKELSEKKLGKVNKEAGLSMRDQKILKSIISHKVKDSFNTVTQREKNTKTNSPQGTNEGQLRKSAIVVGEQALTSSKIKQNKTETVLSEGSSSPSSQAKAKLLESLFKGGENLISTPTRHEEPKVAKEFDDVEKHGALDDSPLGLVVGREQVVDSVGKMAKSVEGERKLEEVGKMPKRDVSPTPIHNREYLYANTVDRDGGISTIPQTPEAPMSSPQKFQGGLEKADSAKSRVIEPTMGSILPIFPKVVVESDTTDKTDGFWHNPSKPKSAVRSVKRITKLNVEKVSHSNKSDFNETHGNEKSKFTKTDGSQKMRTHGPSTSVERLQKRVGKSAIEPKKTLQVAAPTFFPFETPTVKELEQNISTPQGESFPLSQSSSYPHIYEIDFCKLGTESKPGLDALSQTSCKVPLSRVKEFPMINDAKMSYPTPKTAISIKHDTDVMLRRTLSQMPAVTKVLGTTLSAKSQQALERWKQGLINTLGEDGYKQFVENQLRQGSNFHSTMGRFLANKMDCKDDLCMKSMANVFPHISDIGVIESQVVHPQLAYRGIVDCVAKYKGKPVAIEWKRSDKAKPTIKHTYDAPLQLSAYIGALNFDNNYKLQVEGGMVVVAYSDGSPADVFEIPLEDCQRYWTKWLKRLYQFYARD